MCPAVVFTFNSIYWIPKDLMYHAIALLITSFNSMYWILYHQHHDKIYTPPHNLSTPCIGFGINEEVVRETYDKMSLIMSFNSMYWILQVQEVRAQGKAKATLSTPCIGFAIEDYRSRASYTLSTPCIGFSESDPQASYVVKVLSTPCIGFMTNCATVGGASRASLSTPCIGFNSLRNLP